MKIVFLIMSLYLLSSCNLDSSKRTKAYVGMFFETTAAQKDILKFMIRRAENPLL